MSGIENGLGEYLRRQRELADLSLRQFSQVVGVSNAYLSQIERGLRRPSDEVLGSIAGALRISADTLTDLSGRRDAAAESTAVLDAIRADDSLTTRQRQTLAEMYAAFRDVNRSKRPRRRRPGAEGPSEPITDEGTTT